MKVKPVTPNMANVLAAINCLSAKTRHGKRVPAHIVDATYYASAINGLIDRGLLVLKSNPTHEDWWYEIVGKE
jgi:hypothetical protein